MRALSEAKVLLCTLVFYGVAQKAKAVLVSSSLADLLVPGIPWLLGALGYKSRNQIPSGIVAEMTTDTRSFATSMPIAHSATVPRSGKRRTTNEVAVRHPAASI